MISSDIHDIHQAFLLSLLHRPLGGHMLSVGLWLYILFPASEPLPVENRDNPRKKIRQCPQGGSEGGYPSR